MKLSDYYKMIEKISGQPVPEDDPRVTRKDFDANDGPGRQGSWTITYVDGIPAYLNWYQWQLDLDWMFTEVEKELGSKFKLSNWSGSNGHGGADLELIQNE